MTLIAHYDIRKYPNCQPPTQVAQPVLHSRSSATDIYILLCTSPPTVVSVLITHTHRVAMFWNRGPATAAVEDSYTSLPQAKSRRRSEPPAALALQSEMASRQRRAPLQSNPPVNRDNEGERGGQRQEDNRRVRLSSRMGRQRSCSDGVNTGTNSHRRASWFEPPFPGTGEDKEEDEEEGERSVRLQGVPVEIGIGMGRQRSQSAGHKTLQRPYPQRHLRRHETQFGHPGMSVGVGTVAEGEEQIVGLQGTSAEFGIGRRRSRSAGESKRPPQRQEFRSGIDCESIGVINGEEGRNIHSQGTGMGRQRSQSMGEGPHRKSNNPTPPLAHTRPLALVEKYSRRNDPSSPYAHPSPTAGSQSRVPLSLGQTRPLCHDRSPFQAHSHPRPQPSSQPPIPRSILRTHSYASDRDASSANVPNPGTSHSSLPPVNPRAPPLAIDHMHLSRNHHLTTVQGKLPASVRRPTGHTSPLPPSHSLSRILKRCAPEHTYEQSPHSSTSGYVGQVRPDTLLDMNENRIVGGTRHPQPPPLQVTSPNNGKIPNISSPDAQVRTKTAAATHGICNARDEHKAPPNLPNPHPLLGEEHSDDSEKDSGISCLRY